MLLKILKLSHLEDSPVNAVIYVCYFKNIWVKIDVDKNQPGIMVEKR